MSVLAGLAILRGGPDVNGAMALIDYLIQPGTQTKTTRSVGFFPVTKIELPSDFDASLKLAIDAVDKTQAAEDALLTLPPSGLGSRSADFDKILIDTFQLVVLLHHKPRSVLDSKAATLQLLMTETGASCWQPDPPSIGVCQVQ
jgi:multiple sugar transport system substrate-binding protein